jgi:RimJ/RimL family protein N-acetyltransferase
MADPKTAGSVAGAHQSIDQTRRVVSDLCADPLISRAWTVHFEGQIVGWVCIFDVLDRVGQIAFFIAAGRQRLGFGGESVGAMANYAFNCWGLHRLWAQTPASNIAACRLLERLGFQQEGRLRQHYFENEEYYDCYLYGLLAF